MNDKKVHIGHCYQGEYGGSCKYGDENCPAKETKWQKYERIAKAMRDEFLESGIPEEQHVAAVAMMISHMEEIKFELKEFMDGIKEGLIARRDGKVVSWDDVKKELGLKEEK